MVLYQDILDIDSAFHAITQGPDSLKTYVVQEGDSYGLLQLLTILQ